MYSLFNKHIIYNFLVCVLIFLMQGFAPKIFISDSISVSLDFLLVLVTFLVFFNQTFYIIILAFIFGLLQDLIVNVEVIGLCSFIKSLSVYYISKIKLNNNLWNRYFKFSYILFIYFAHFLIYYSIVNSELNFLIVSLSFLHSISALIVFFIFEKILFNSKLF